jgi:UDP:flavonoid glycosyltransferase YjiC (YdhE family)
LRVHRNITLYSYAPQIEILPATDLFITHGGANSVMEAIALGVKRLWISPMCNDQYHQSYYIEKSGIGKTYDLQQMSTEDIREKISEFLSDSEMALRMKAVAQSYQQNGAMVSAELIRQIL